MKITSLHIKNFKSIVDLEIIEPNPFTVFVGPNGAGKSNIFEALEFFDFGYKYSETTINIFGGRETFCNRGNIDKDVIVNFRFNESYTVNCYKLNGSISLSRFGGSGYITDASYESPEVERFLNSNVFSRIFVKNKDIQRINLSDSRRLSLSCENLEKVLKRILKDRAKEEEIFEWMQLLIPEFANIEIDGDNKLNIREKYSSEPFEKSLISDGTFNILALLTAVYQSDEPQFLCIEEPENGLNPFVIRKLVDFFRAACAEKGHYIWLNTHSQTLVECLNPEEVIVVDKIGGETKIKQIKGMNLHGLDMAEVWLSGALGGGTPW